MCGRPASVARRLRRGQARAATAHAPRRLRARRQATRTVSASSCAREVSWPASPAPLARGRRLAAPPEHLGLDGELVRAAVLRRVPRRVDELAQLVETLL